MAVNEDIIKALVKPYITSFDSLKKVHLCMDIISFDLFNQIMIWKTQYRHLLLLVSRTRYTFDIDSNIQYIFIKQGN